MYSTWNHLTPFWMIRPPCYGSKPLNTSKIGVMSDIIWRSPWQLYLYINMYIYIFIYNIYNTVSASHSLILQIRPFEQHEIKSNKCATKWKHQQTGKKRNKQSRSTILCVALYLCMFFRFRSSCKTLCVFFFTFLYFDRFLCCSLFAFYRCLFLFVRRFLQTLSVCSLVFFNKIYFASFCGCAVGVSLLYCFSLACLVLVAVGLVSGCPLCSAFCSTIRIVEIKVKW